jgi:hypothetical protein
VIVQEVVNKSNNPIQKPVIISHGAINTCQYAGYAVQLLNSLDAEQIGKCVANCDNKQRRTLPHDVISLQHGKSYEGGITLASFTEITSLQNRNFRT